MRRSLTLTLSATAALATLGATLGATPGQATPRPVLAASPGSSTATLDPLVTQLATSAVTARLAAAFPDEKPQLKDTVTWSDGTTYARYERTWKGLPVVGGRYTVAIGGGKKTLPAAADGTIAKAPIAAKSTAPRLSAAAATGEAREAATKDREVDDAAQATQPVAPKLVVYVDRTGAGKLAYDVYTEAANEEKGEARFHTYVDANTGAVLGKQHLVQGATDSGNGVYSGKVSFSTKVDSSDTTFGDAYGNQARDARHLNVYGSNYDWDGYVIHKMDNGDMLWGSGSLYSGDKQGVDAQFALEQTYAFYANTYGRRGQANDGRGIIARTHAARAALGSTTDPCWNNATWSGDHINLGDGPGCTRPFTELDIVAHEVTHGVTWYTAGLEYELESGGLNESMSDIFGTMTELYASRKGLVPADAWDYKIGEKMPWGSRDALRYMDKPSKDGSSLDCWSANIAKRDAYGNELIDVHNSSGPMNHAFYLLSNGSGNRTVNGVAYSSATCNGSTVSGIGPDAAARIVYGALTSPNLPTTATYLQFRDEMVRAASATYGTGSVQCMATESAMSAIGVPPSSTSPRCIPPMATADRIWPRDGSGDKIADLETVRATDGGIVEFAGTTTPAFANGVARGGVDMRTMPKRAVTGQWDGIGAGDLVATDSAGRLWLYSQRQETGYWIKGNLLGTGGWGTYTKLFSPGDLDSNGYTDLIGIDAAGDMYAYRRASTTGAMTARVKIGWGWDGMKNVFPAADFNSDGRLDIMAVDGAGALWLYKGEAGGGFGNRVKLGSGGWLGFTGVSSLGDLDADGRPDLIGITNWGTLVWYKNVNGSYLAGSKVLRTGMSGYTMIG